MRTDPSTPAASKKKKFWTNNKKDISFPIPVISEEAGVVTLHFESEYVQSQMIAERPDFLALSYTRAMMLFDLLKPDAGNIVIIGLGGGSLAKWCHRHHPRTALTVVEINPHVIALRDKFHIPPDDHRFKVLCADGAKFIAKQKNKVDVLLVDAFSVDSLPEDLSSQSFYDSCHRALSAEGLLVVNLCAADEEAVVARIRESFGGKVSRSSNHDGNSVIFACKGSLMWPCEESSAFLADKLTEFEKKYEMTKAVAPVG
ncbi:fused MFS/spermidine synthase [Silvibacterium acidisoli]|uniref:fused MFS/spermidine synthase n=1 Tax=Acidobacteriaceae bacterium ZG23-2 TaxID=2883246 RepID=UPI00406C5E28